MWMEAQSREQRTGARAKGARRAGCDSGEVWRNESARGLLRVAEIEHEDGPHRRVEQGVGRRGMLRLLLLRASHVEKMSEWVILMRSRRLMTNLERSTNAPIKVHQQKTFNKPQHKLMNYGCTIPLARKQQSTHATNMPSTVHNVHNKSYIMYC